MANSHNDGGMAFPVPNDADVNGNPGMTLRDWFAGTVAATYAGKTDYVNQSGMARLWTPSQVAKTAYAIADAMIAERDRNQEG